MLHYIRTYLLRPRFCGSALLVASIIIFLALITYNAADPSFNVASKYLPNNFLQYFGSYLADGMYQIFGITAFVIPIACVVWGATLLKNARLKWSLLKIILIIFSILLWSLAFANIKSRPLPTAWGGSIGTLLLPIFEDYALLTGPMIGWLCCAGSIAFFLGLGLHPNFYVNFFSKLFRIKIPKLQLRLPWFNFWAKNTNQIIVRKSPIMGREQAAQVASDKTSKNFIKQRVDETFAILPDINLLNDPDKQTVKKESADQLKQNAEELLKVLKDFGVRGHILDINQGPVVTLYEFEPAAGTKSSRVIGLADDIARSLSAISTRISVIPGRNVLGIELPNKHRAFFCLKELIETAEYQNHNILLPIILGKDLAGRPYIADLAKMPHLLVAGTTGSGKSVAINTMIMSLLYRYSPSECKMIMIDPKMLELSIYDNIPHLLTPVVTEAPKAIVALKWAVKEMENRYRLMSNVGVRNIAGYNAKILEAKTQGKNLERTVHTGFDPETGKAIYETMPIALEKLPFIVVIVDEMADLMIVAGKDIESSIQRLAQMARAAGIHIIMATQRPSVDVITGVIKANFPSRISFKVTSKIDSRTILGEQGSEQLLGMGDMLYMGSSASITRVHGPFVADSEVERVTNYLKSIASPEYVTAVTENSEDDDESLDIIDGDTSNDEALYKQAVQIVKREKKVSISYIQRVLRIGYNKSANIVEKMEKNGVVSPPNHSGKREVYSEDSA
jgi:DNA segregation ATPase FtsK/SpoIIIE, S-DNA-T family